VSVYIAFVASSLHRYPAIRARVVDDAQVEAFVQEVRRFHPFFPAVVARVRESFEWRGFRFPAGTRTMLDLYGTNHDKRIFTEPQAFWPARFTRGAPDPFGFIPQGGGEHMGGHRCPGEWITVALMKGAVRMLTRRLRYDVPDQDLETDFTRLPALPKSRVVLANVRFAERNAPVPVSPVHLTVGGVSKV
jgi:fatty-acid peroxygenase